jgi:hypothetical protein
MPAGDAFQLRMDGVMTALGEAILRPRDGECEWDQPVRAAACTSDRVVSIRPFHARYFATARWLGVNEEHAIRGHPLR